MLNGLIINTLCGQGHIFQGVKHPEYPMGEGMTNSIPRDIYAFLSDYLTDLYTEKSKINFINSPQWGLNPQPLDHHYNTLPTELSHYFVVCVNH